MDWRKTSIICIGAAMVLLASSAAAQETPAAEPDGQALYDQHCKKCHGPAGGSPPAAMTRLMENLTSVTDPAFLAATPDDSLVGVIQQGRGKMKPFTGELAEEDHRLTSEEVLAIVKFLRASGPAPTPTEVPQSAEPAEAVSP